MDGTKIPREYNTLDRKEMTPTLENVELGVGQVADDGKATVDERAGFHSMVMLLQTYGCVRE